MFLKNVQPLRRRFLASAAVLLVATATAVAQQPPSEAVPTGTTLVVADQNEELQTLMAASGEQSKLAGTVTYANFLGGPSILEAFRAGALDAGLVGSGPPIQAHAAGETIRIFGARQKSGLEYHFGVRPGLKLTSFGELRGKRIAYAEGTGRQPFVLEALSEAGLKPADVTLVPLRVSDFPDAVRGNQVDLAALNEPHYSRYLADYADRGAVPLADAIYAKMPRNLMFLYASEAALKDAGKTAALRDLFAHFMVANEWAEAHRDAWVQAYYVGKGRLKPADARAIVDNEGAISFPSLASLVPLQQHTIDLIHDAGDIPQTLDAAAEFDLRFDTLARLAPLGAGIPNPAPVSGTK